MTEGSEDEASQVPEVDVQVCHPHSYHGMSGTACDVKCM